jgi:ABC-type oligopeptide transport system substrate-binding subunit/class 3 adenylate cyclase
VLDQEQLEQAIEALENQRANLGDHVVDAALVPMREQLAALIEAQEATQQRKLATILFLDIVGSTSITHDLDPEDTMAIMDNALQRFAKPIYDHGGRVTRYMGDGLLALFGSPVARENEPEMAVRAGLQILTEAQAYARELEAERGIPNFNVRVGISTGLVIIGGDIEAENTLMGTTVILASRLEDVARPGTLLISHHTYQHVRGLFEFQLLDPILVKGFDDPIQVYRVIRPKPLTFHMATWSVAGIKTNMIGRDPELLMLQNMFRDTIEDSVAQVVTIVGEAGVGKSRLVYEFEKWIALLQEDIWYLTGRAAPEAEPMPYGLIRSIFTHRFDILESDSTMEVREKFRAGMAVALTPDKADLVGQLLGFDFTTSQVVQDQLGSESFGEMAIGCLADYLRVVAKNPTVVILEDLHWADDSSLALLVHLEMVAPDTRMLVICTARPALYERHPTWSEGQVTHRQIPLKPLSRRASRALVSEIMQKAEDVPSALSNMVVESAEGNPFYLEELIKMLIEDGVIEPGEQQWCVELGRLEEVHVPPTLTGVIQARLDSLPGEERTLLHCASVVGRVFWDRAVVELTSEDTKALEIDKLRSVLDNLCRREIVFRREQSTFANTEEYIFKHALLRDVIYETVLLKQRKVYHEQVAAWLEANAGERLEEYLGLISGHYDLAGDHSKAVEYLQRAGDKARLAYAHQEAVDYYRRALAMLKEQNEYGLAARTLMKLGLVFHTAFDYKRSRQAYEEGFVLIQQEEDVQLDTKRSPAPHAFRMARANPTTLDPTMADDSFSGGIINQLFSGLVEGRLAMEAMPDVARSWELSADGRRYIFHLREDVHWTDGKLVTSRDFEYAWKRVLDPKTGSPNASLLYDIKGAKAYHHGEDTDPEGIGLQTPDDLTFIVELEEPTGYFLSLLAHYAAYPIPRHVLEAHGEAWTGMSNLVTNGAFRLETWVQDERMTLVRNPDYHGSFPGNVEKVEISFDIRWFVQMEKYERDELEFVSFGGSPLERDRARRRHAGEYTSAPMLGATYVGFNVSRPPFDDLRVRRAFALATDQVTLADVVLRGYEFPATGGFVPPGMPGHTADIGLSYDPGQAQELLAQAGYPGGDGFPVVTALTWQGIKARADCLYEQWRDNLGIEIAWEVKEFSEFIETVDQSPVHMIQTVWMPDYPDPDSVLRTSPIRRRTHWRNEEYDRLVEEARRVLDQEERMDLYSQADRILVLEEAVIIPLTYMWSHLLVKPWVRKLPKSAINEWLWKDFVMEAHDVQPPRFQGTSEVSKALDH